VDIEKILIACAAHGVAVEVNANPWRLDLDWRWHRRAVELGCWMSINPDAHSIAEIDLTHWGVEMARKGAVPRSGCSTAWTRAVHGASRAALDCKGTRLAARPRPINA